MTTHKRNEIEIPEFLQREFELNRVARNITEDPKYRRDLLRKIIRRKYPVIKDLVEMVIFFAALIFSVFCIWLGIVGILILFG